MLSRGPACLPASPSHLKDGDCLPPSYAYSNYVPLDLHGGREGLDGGTNYRALPAAVSSDCVSTCPVRMHVTAGVCVHLPHTLISVITSSQLTKFNFVKLHFMPISIQSVLIRADSVWGPGMLSGT